MKKLSVALMAVMGISAWAPSLEAAADEAANAADSRAISVLASESGGADDHSGWTYYFKPHPPDCAIVKVQVAGASDYGLPDKDHKYCLDGFWNDETGVAVRLLYVTKSGYLFADGSTSNTWETIVTENGQEVDPPADVVVVKAQAKSGSSDYLTLAAAVAAAKNRARITLCDDATLDETLTVTNSITLDLDAHTLTLDRDLTAAFRFTAGATVSNGTITSARTANAAGSALMRFTDCKATLRDLTIRGRGYEVVVARDSLLEPAQKYANSRRALDTVTCDGLTLTGNGRLLAVDHARATLTNACSFTADATLASFGGTFEAAVSCFGNGTVTIADGTYAAPKALQSGDLGGAFIVNGGSFTGEIYSWMAAGVHTNLEQNADYKARFAFRGGTYARATLAFAYSDSFDFSAFAKDEAVALAAPAGYVWKDNVLARESLAAEGTRAPYSNAQAAADAARAINAAKADCIAVPADVDAAAYLDRVEAAVTSDNCLVLDLTPAAAVAEQAALDAAITSAAVVAALVRVPASDTVRLERTTPGLFYWILGGTRVDAITQAGPSVMSTDGGAVELAKPTLDAGDGGAFFRLAAGVASPRSADR